MFRSFIRPVSHLAFCLATGLGLLLGNLTAFAAPPAIDVAAVQALTVQADGPKKGDNGDKYFNVEGKQTGKYASYGLLRFDGATLKKDLDKKYGPGWKIATVTLLLTESRAGFTKDGPFELYFRADPMSDLNVQTLKYPYDPKSKALGGTKISLPPLSRKTEKVEAEEQIMDAYNLTQNPAGNALMAALEQGHFVTLVLDAGDSLVADTYAGLKGVKHRKAPTLVITIKQ